MEKSHVGMEYKICPVCHEKHDEVVLLDGRLKDTLPLDMMMGYELCPKHAAMSEEYVALIEVTKDPNQYPQSTQFTGATAHVRWEAADNIFDCDMSRRNPFVFIGPGVITQLQEIAR